MARRTVTELNDEEKLTQRRFHLAERLEYFKLTNLAAKLKKYHFTSEELDFVEKSLAKYEVPTTKGE
jgi:hypothetical protein